MLHLDKGRN